MCEALFWVWNLGSEDIFWVWNFVVTFFGWEILVRTFWGLTKRVLVFMSNNCIMTQKLSGILLNCYYYVCLIGLFWGYVLGRLTCFESGSRLKDFFGLTGLTISPHAHIPVTNTPEYPPPPLGYTLCFVHRVREDKALSVALFVAWGPCCFQFALFI